MAVGEFMQRAANRDYSKYWQDPKSFPAMMQKPKQPITGRPISVRENYVRAVTGKQPYWMPAYSYESNMVWPDAIEEHPVPETCDGYDWWGVLWQWVPSAGGSITKPGTRVINNFENWKEEVPWPDLSVVDFKADGLKLQQNLDPDRPHVYECVEGIFERLHEMMPFDETLLLFYEEPELLEEFFQKMADYKIDLCKNVFEYYGRIDGVLYHDDWGTQKSGFFSNEMFDAQIMPATKRVFDYIKSQGKFIELHSCGNNSQYCPEMIELGVDLWTPQWNCNDADKLHNTYGKQMSFTFPLRFKPEDDEATIRSKVRDFVDHFGENGRALCSLGGKPEQTAIGRDELFNYSFEYYNKLYHRV